MKKLYEAPQAEVDKFRFADITTEGVSTGIIPEEENKDDFDF